MKYYCRNYFEKKKKRRIKVEKNEVKNFQLFMQNSYSFANFDHKIFNLF